MSNNSAIKTYITGLVVENGQQESFERQLAVLRDVAEKAKAVSEEEYATFILALSYVTAEETE